MSKVSVTELVIISIWYKYLLQCSDGCLYVQVVPFCDLEVTTSSVMTTTTAALAPMTSTALTDDATIHDYPVTVGGVDI